MAFGAYTLGAICFWGYGYTRLKTAHEKVNTSPRILSPLY